MGKQLPLLVCGILAAAACQTAPPGPAPGGGLPGNNQAVGTPTAEVRNQQAPEQVLLQAMDRMDDVKTARFNGQGTVTVEAQGGDTRLTTEMKANGSIVFPDRQKATVTVERPVRLETEIVRIGDDVWVREPGRNQWVKETVDAGQMTQSIDPMQAMLLARAASKEIKHAGQDQIGGAETRRIEVVLDPQRTRILMEQANADLRGHVDHVEGSVSVWVDRSNYVRQIQPDITMQLKDIPVADQQTVEGRFHTKMTAQLDGFDEQVTIEPPI